MDFHSCLIQSQTFNLFFLDASWHHLYTDICYLLILMPLKKVYRNESHGILTCTNSNASVNLMPKSLCILSQHKHFWCMIHSKKYYHVCVNSSIIQQIFFIILAITGTWCLRINRRCCWSGRKDTKFLYARSYLGNLLSVEGHFEWGKLMHVLALLCIINLIFTFSGKWHVTFFNSMSNSGENVRVLFG